MLGVVPAAGFAQGEHGRRAGAELLVLLGDVERLLSGQVPPKQQIGLRDRIRGGLAPLPLLLRRADQERARVVPRVDVSDLRPLLAQGRLDALLERLQRLRQDYPFHGHGLFPATPSAGRHEMAQRLHSAHCAACHDHPFLDTERPAFNLSRQSRQMSSQEFAARMVVGVRGERSIGLDNPLTDREIAALIAYYRSGNLDERER